MVRNFEAQEVCLAVCTQHPRKPDTTSSRSFQKQEVIGVVCPATTLLKYVWLSGGL